MLKLDQCLAANRPLTFVVAESDIEVLLYLNEKHKEGRFSVYSTTFASLVPLKNVLNDKFVVSNKKAQTTTEVLEEILSHSFSGTNSRFETYVFLDADSYINDKQVLRKIKDIVARYQLDESYQGSPWQI